MTGKDLKDWANTLPDNCIIEMKGYDWEDIDAQKIRAIMRMPPQINELKEA